MALIVCPECGHKISSYADKCINCGCPMSVIQKLLDSSKQQQVAKPKKIKSQKKSEEKMVAYKVPENVGSFIECLNPSYRDLYADFRAEFLHTFSDLRAVEIRNVRSKSFYIGIRYKDSDVNWFFVSAKNGNLIFNYRDKPEYSKEVEVHSHPIKSKADFSKIIVLVDQILKANIKKPAKTEKTSEERLYSYIVSALKEKKINASSEFQELAKNVAKFVNDEMKANAKLTNPKRYDKYKYGEFVAVKFFGKSYYYRYISNEDAKRFYCYYKAFQIFNLIKQYEKTLNKTIIFDQDALLDSLLEMNNEGFDPNKLKGIGANIVLVPEDTMNRKWHSFDKFEE